MITRALMMRAVVICMRSHKFVGFSSFYDVSIAKKSKVNSKFSRVSFTEFFLNFAHFEILKTLVEDIVYLSISICTKNCYPVRVKVTQC